MYQTINHVLEEAAHGAAAPLLWLTTKRYEEAPKKKERKANLGQEPPISVNWTSPFIGWKVEHVAKRLQEKPETVDLDSHHFAILDMKATEGSVVVCKIGDEDLQGDSLSFVRKSARHMASFLNGMEPYTWEEQFEGVRGRKRHVEIDYGDGGKSTRTE